MEVKIIIFDQDGTLYSKKHQLYKDTSSLTKKWISESLKVSLENVETLYKQLSIKYPNPYCGFQSLGLSVEKYMSNVFDKIEPEKYLKFNPIIYNYFKNSKEKKILVTFASPRYTKKLQEKLEIEKFYDKILYVKDFKSYTKKECYQEIAKKYGVSNNEMLVIGDSFENDIRPAIELGCQTVFISENGDFDNIEDFIKNKKMYLG